MEWAKQPSIVLGQGVLEGVLARLETAFGRDTIDQAEMDLLVGDLHALGIVDDMHVGVVQTQAFWNPHRALEWLCGQYLHCIRFQRWHLGGALRDAARRELPGWGAQ